jgi:hypothetical protein
MGLASGETLKLNLKLKVYDMLGKEFLYPTLSALTPPNTTPHRTSTKTLK